MKNILIKVFGKSTNPDIRLLLGATVEAVSIDGSTSFKASFDASSEAFLLLIPLHPVHYRIIVAYPGYASQRRYFRSDNSPEEQFFILMEPDAPYFYNQLTQQPFAPAPNLLCIVPKIKDGNPMADLAVFIANQGLTTTPENGLYTYKKHSGNFSSQGDPVLAALRQHENVRHIGIIGFSSDNKPVIFSNNIRIVFANTIPGSSCTEANIAALLSQYNLAEVGDSTYSPAIGTGDYIHTITDELNKNGDVLYAYTLILDFAPTSAVTPADYRYRWDNGKTLVRIPQAWNLLESKFLAEAGLGKNFKYGSMEIITAVLDDGIQSVNGTVIVPDLGTSVAKTTTKLSQTAAAGNTYLEVTDPAGIAEADQVSVGHIYGTTESFTIVSRTLGGVRLNINGTLANSYPTGTIVDINRKAKIYALYDFNDEAYNPSTKTFRSDNDNLGLLSLAGLPATGLPSDHGTAVSGIIAAAADNDSPVANIAFGGCGAAPNTRLIGLVRPYPADYEYWYARIFEWSAGLNPNIDLGSGQLVYPDAITPGADIFNASLGLGETLSSLSSIVRLAFDRVTSRGRNGRGMLLFFSSGNGDSSGNGIELGSASAIAAGVYYAYASYERVFMIGNSSIGFTNPNERSPSSNYGAKLEFAATGELLTTSTIWGRGGGVSFPLISKRVTGPKTVDPDDSNFYRLTAGTTTLELDSIDGLAQDMWITIYDKDLEKPENLFIKSIIGGASNIIQVSSDNPYYNTNNNGIVNPNHFVEKLTDTSIKVTLVADSKLLGTLAAAVAQNAVTITINSVASPNVKSGDELIIGVPSAVPTDSWLWRRERLVVQGPALSNGTNWDIPISPIAKPTGYLAGTTQVILSHAYTTAGFSGTSAASPLAAGIGALVLTANPRLTWVEVRHILRSTAQQTGGHNYNWNPAKPNHSKELGYGVLDAGAAVQAALNYTHTERDLIIRKNLDDAGTAKDTRLNTPDIWVRNLPPATDAVMQNAIATPATLDFNKAGPHQEPYYNKDRQVYTRIHNRGSSAANLDAWIRFYIAFSDGNTAPGDSTLFPWPESWPMPIEAVGSSTNSLLNENGVNFIGEVKISEGAIPAGGNAIVGVPWPLALLTPTLNSAHQLSNNKKIYLLVEITPHDGLLAGNRVDTNNNLCYREVAFAEDKPAEIKFKDVTGDNLLSRVIPVGADGSNVSTDLRLELTDIEPFVYQSAVLEIKRTKKSDGSIETFTFSHNGTVWSAAPSLPAWFTLNNAPVTVIGDSANGRLSSVEFTGTFDLNKDYDKLNLKAKFTYDQPHPTTGILITGLTVESDYNISVVEGMMPSGVGVSEFSKPSLHVFADMNALNQPQPDLLTFGPVPSDKLNKFRVTSSWTASIPVKAYAAVTGTVMIQREGNDRVNLILRPLVQSNIDLTPVKYFIYRGLRRDNFITSAGDDIIPETTLNVSPFIQQLYNSHNSRYPNNTPPALKSKALGYDSSQAANLLIDSFFFSSNPDYQLPIVQKGTELGNFFIDTLYEFGFEIVLEEGEVQLDLGYARKQYHEIDVTTIVNALQLKSAREAIRFYIDPAAYHGLHYESGIRVPSTTSPLKQAALYSGVISKFHTKNTVYIDVRNENGHSMNYYGNYNGTAGSDDEGKHIILNFNGQEERIVYETSSWPIIIKNYDGVATTNAVNSISVRLKCADNQSPLLYVERGVVPVSAPDKGWLGIFPSGFFNLTDPTPYTWTNRPFAISVPNHPSISDATKKVNVAQAVKLHWMRSFAPATWGLGVVQTKHYHDNFFGPLDIQLLTTKKFIFINKNLQWFELQGLHLLNDSINKKMASRGVAFDKVNSEDRVIFFATGSRYNTLKEPLQFADGATNSNSFFHVNHVFKDIKLSIDKIQEDTGGGNPDEVKVLQLTAVPSSKHNNSDALILGLLESEFQKVKNIAGLDSSLHERYITLEEVTSPGGPGVAFADLTTGQPKHYYKYKLSVQGLDSSGDYQKIPNSDPSDTVYVYSIDGYTFASKLFAKDQAEVFDVLDLITYEEEILQNFPQPNEILGFDSTMLGYVTSFETAVSAVADDKDSLKNLSTLASQYGKNIWDRAHQMIKDSSYANPDGRPLYWARLRMRVAIKSHPAMNKSQKDRESVIRTLEKTSRGYDIADFSSSNPAFALANNPGITIDFNTVKKVLVSGYDPGSLNPDDDQNIYSDNLSGVIALAIHDSIVVDGSNNAIALVQAVLFPVRYSDIDGENGKGVIEDYFEKYIDPASASPKADYIFTLSRDDYPFTLYFDRFAARTRSQDRYQADNENQIGSIVSKTFPAGIAGDKFIEATLPANKIVPLDAASNNGTYKIYYRQDFEYLDENGQTNKYIPQPGPDNQPEINGIEKLESMNPAPIALTGTVPAALTAADMSKITPISGSGGNYLSNEIFYRVSALRKRLNPSLSNAHLHLPHYSSFENDRKNDYDATRSKEITELVIGLIKKAVQ